MNLYYCLYQSQVGERKEQAGHKVGYALLSYALEKEYGICGLPRIEKGRYGKPYFLEYPQIHFNISHCDGIAACVLADQEVGIDVEGWRRVNPSLVNKALTKKEREELQRESTEEFEMGFLRYWTLKESFIKAIGKGLSFPLCEIEFSLVQENSNQTASNPILLAEDMEQVLSNSVSISSNQKDWQFFQILLKEKYLLSVCFPRNFPNKEQKVIECYLK